MGALEQFPKNPLPLQGEAGTRPTQGRAHPPLRRADPIHARPGAIFPWDSGCGGSHLESRLGGSAGRAYRPGWATAARCLLS